MPKECMSFPPPSHLQLGVCDYPEQVPPQLGSEYAQAQKALGLRFVRLAEFAWSRRSRARRTTTGPGWTRPSS